MKFIKTVLAFVASILLICVLVAIGSEDEDKGHAKINQTTTKQEMKQETKKVKEPKKSNEEIRMDQMMNDELGYFDTTDFSYTSTNVIPVPYMEGNGDPDSYIELSNLILQYLGDEGVICSSSTDQRKDEGYEILYKYCLDKKNNRDIVFRCKLKYTKHNEGIEDYAIYSIALLRPLVNDIPMSDSEVKNMMSLEYFSRLHDRVEDSTVYKEVDKSRDFSIPKNNK